MFDWQSIAILLAADAKQPEPNPLLTFAPLIILFVLFYMIILRPQRQAQKKQQSMLDALKKNDKVITRGGIMGSVANIAPDGTKVTIKIDDNTRIPIHRSYVEHVLTDDDTSDVDKKS